MKLLYMYRYGILGGVCTQLLHRLRHLDRKLGIEVHCGFLSDHGVSDMLSPYATLHFGLNGENTASFLEQGAFDLVVVIDSEEYLQAIKTMENRPTLLVEVHTSIERNLSYLSRIQPNEVEGFFTVSEYMKTRIQAHASESLGSPQISLFSNVLDTDLFSPKSLNAEGPPVVCWVGKIDDHKDWKAFMHISERIHEGLPEAEFWIIGGQTCSQERANEVFDLADEKGIIERFRWIDRVENVNMPKLYSLVSQRGGIKLVTSHCESFGMSVLEALLSGCPVVATDVGALSEIVQENEAYTLYQLKDFDAASVKAQHMLENQPRLVRHLTALRPSLVELYDSQHRVTEYWSKLLVYGDDS